MDVAVFKGGYYAKLTFLSFILCHNVILKLAQTVALTHSYMFAGVSEMVGGY